MWWGRGVCVSAAGTSGWVFNLIVSDDVSLHLYNGDMELFWLVSSIRPFPSFPCFFLKLFPFLCLFFFEPL